MEIGAAEKIPKSDPIYREVSGTNRLLYLFSRRDTAGNVECITGGASSLPLSIRATAPPHVLSVADIMHGQDKDGRMPDAGLIFMLKNLASLAVLGLGKVRRERLYRTDNHKPANDPKKARRDRNGPAAATATHISGWQERADCCGLKYSCVGGTFLCGVFQTHTVGKVSTR